MKFRIPEKVSQILNTLHAGGFDAFVVGGCVRDSLIGREPDDWDITTEALPHQVKKLFRTTIDTGIRHGTVTVLLGKDGYEVTTYRLDGKYEDFRHPSEVTFTRKLGEDLKRRDFTINAMAYDPGQGLIDLFGGEQDLKDGVIRCVGNAEERFTEDALRIMRAVRFSAQLGFCIEGKTFEAMRNLSGNLVHVSAERIRTELMKLIVSPNPDYLRTAWQAGITKIFLPEFDLCMETPQNNPHHRYTVGEHILASMKMIRPEPVLRLTMLLHDIGKPSVRTTDSSGKDHFVMHGIAGRDMAEEIMRRLKMDNRTIHDVSTLIYWHDYRPEPVPRQVRKAVNLIGEDLFPLFLEIQKADCLAQSNYMQEEKLRRIAGVEACYSQILASRDCVSLKTLAVNGRDLQEAGFPPGKAMGTLLNRLLEHVLLYPVDNQKERLLELAGTMRKTESSGQPQKSPES